MVDYFEGFGVGSTMVMWLSRLLLIFVLGWCGYNMGRRPEEEYKKYAWIAGITFTLIEGLRWLRGVDYYHYYNDLVSVFGEQGGTIGRGTLTPDPEYLYDIWVRTFHASGLPFWVAFCFYSGLLIYAFLRVVRHFPRTAVWALPVFFIVIGTEAENLIRQYFAAAFLILAFAEYLDGKMFKMVVCLVIVPFIHYSGVMAEAPFVLLILMERSKALRKILNSDVMLLLLIGMFVFCWFFWDSSNFTHIARAIGDTLDFGDNKASTYTDYSERWFSEEGSISQVLTGKAAGAAGMIKQLTQFITYLSLIWLGFLAMRRNRSLTLPVYFTAVALIVKTASGDIEMFIRLYNWLILFMPIVLGYILVLFRNNRTLRGALITVYIIYFLYYSMFISIRFAAISGYGFIWNANVPLW